MHRCKSDGSWTPCHGGPDPGAEGDGFCAVGYQGPRCEVCARDEQFFETLDARCHDCGNVAGRSAAVLCVLSLPLLAGALGGAAIIRRSQRPICANILRTARSVQTLWKRCAHPDVSKAFVDFFLSTRVHCPMPLSMYHLRSNAEHTARKPLRLALPSAYSLP
jgi:hypothetical protein